ncbi:hypothetical protein L1049_007557 [Liquidambar formosana]|uniref:Protein YIP n=1 Tax=Liquidambar formosana TaxID=63359 RepID=A0AAP0X4Q1_LIQFO
MAREFAVPPVIFPSGGISSGPGGLQHRRIPTAPFQPPRSAISNIPFMSFDIGSTTAGNIASGSSVGGGADFGDEEPLLDELGIYPDQIWRKTVSILNPLRLNPDVHDDSDLSGPVLYYILFGFFQLLAGKIQFGAILGWIVIFSLFMYVVFNMLADRTGNLDLHRCTSVVGYSMLPVVIFSAISLFVPRGGMVGFALAAFFVMWATRVCARLLIALAGGGDEHLGLIAYACFLIYTLFSMLVMF